MSASPLPAWLFDRDLLFADVRDGRLTVSDGDGEASAPLDAPPEKLARLCRSKRRVFCFVDAKPAMVATGASRA